MSKYTFTHDPDLSGSPKITVEFDDAEHPFIGDVLAAFEQFLLGVGFHPDTIEKYLDSDKIFTERTDMMRRVEELQADLIKRKAK